MKRTIIALVLGMLIGSSATALAANTETVQAVFAEFKIMINGQEKQLQTTPLVVEGTSYLPVREVANLLGAEVGYDESTRTISLSKEENDKMTAADEWIAVRDIAKHFPGTEVLYGPQDGKERVLSITRDTLQIGVLNFVPPESGEEILDLITTTGESVRVKFNNDTSYLRLSDLKKLGFQ